MAMITVMIGSNWGGHRPPRPPLQVGLTATMIHCLLACLLTGWVAGLLAGWLASWLAGPDAQLARAEKS